MSKDEDSEIVDEEINQKKEMLEDFISGVPVQTGPEEVYAVQVFSKKLVKDYGYEKKQIQTRPQFRVKVAPSGQEKYPVDIAVFRTDKKTYDNVYMLIECKQPNKKEGRKQLDIYLNLVPSVEIGVWFNGKEHLYLRKVTENDRIEWKDIPDIPKKGERIQDIGYYKRKDLIKPDDLKIIFDDIRNHLAGNTTGITRDEAIASEIINLLFCKLYDEISTEQEEQVSFRAGIEEKKQGVKKRIEKIFEDVKKDYDDVFDTDEHIKLDDESIVYVVGELQKYCITDADRDAIGDAFEVFIGPALRGSEGQFFTPRNVVKMVVKMIDPEPGEYIIDPACGSGGFLIIALEHVWSKIETAGKRKKWSQQLIISKKKDVATKFFSGIDKDSFLAKVTKAYMAIVGDGRGGIFCENSLLHPEEWNNKTTNRVELGKFNILFTNPPFGIKIPIRGEKTLEQYNLGYKWKLDKESGTWHKTNKLADKKPPQILFIERCLQLLEPGGRMGIVLPDSVVGNQTDGYIREYILSQARLLAVIDCPPETFLPGTSTKTSVALLEKKKESTEKEYKIFMAVAEKCGHDRRGKRITKLDKNGEIIPDDDLPEIVDAYKKFREDY